MKPFFKLIPVLVLSFFMASCAASGPKFTELSNSISTLPPDTGRIFIYRTSFLGAGVQPEVKLNGEIIGKAIPQGFFYADRKPGNYEVLTSTEVDRRLSLTLNSGQVRYVRLDVSFGFENHYIRGLKKMKLRCGLAMIVMLGMALGRVKEKQREKLRSLVAA